MTTTTKSQIIRDVTVTICLTEDEGLSIQDGGKWLLMCESHGYILQGTNKTRLWSNRFEVADWCEECRAKAAGL
jgi:hypothetical protein